MDNLFDEMPVRRRLTARERAWFDNYMRLKEYITANRHLPDKRCIDNRELLNWWKYNRKKALAGLLEDWKLDLIERLSHMRDNYRD